jgi:hypothetical protein
VWLVKKFNDHMGNRSRDLPASTTCAMPSIVSPVCLMVLEIIKNDILEVARLIFSNQKRLPNTGKGKVVPLFKQVSTKP